MLILTRRPSETITIGHDVTVTVVRVEGNKVRLAIDAPKKIPVHRAEIADLLADKRAIEQSLAKEREENAA